LSILDQEHHEKSDDRGAGVDDELPGVGEPKDWSGEDPGKDECAGYDKGTGIAGLVGYTFGDTVEDFVHIGKYTLLDDVQS